MEDDDEEEDPTVDATPELVQPAPPVAGVETELPKESPGFRFFPPRFGFGPQTKQPSSPSKISPNTMTEG